MARKKRPVQRETFSMDHNGITYDAQYYVEDGIVTIDATTKDLVPVERSAILIDPSKPLFLARVLLRELIDGGRLG